MIFEDGVEQILLTREGIKLINYNIEKKEINVIKVVHDVFEYLAYPVKAHYDLLFEDVLIALFKQRNEISIFFKSYMNEVNIDDLYFDFTNEYVGNDYFNEDLELLSELNLVSFNHYHENVNIPDDLDPTIKTLGSILHSFETIMGVINLPSTLDDDESEVDLIDVAHIPLSELAKFPFFINTYFNIHGTTHNPENVMEYDEFSVLHTTKAFTLFDLISATLMAITLFGGPNERYENFMAIKKETEEIYRRNQSIDDLLNSLNDDDE